ncbi:DDE-type integrase/transposase/recombinase [Candidatus Poriferisocius sp.]|uniref:DDE-type integrase/transposase/recombinase n=1 Tax=Candidatus Poriferisocius sp. TaxID=3101276 RepID=UPI003B51E07F
MSSPRSRGRSRRTYGWRRVQAELAEVYGHRAGLNLLLSLMREQQICGLPRRKGRKSGRSPAETTADLVNRQFDRDGPNQLWMTDITEHPTREGKLYLCAVLDAWSRKVVGWSIDRRATSAMVTSALAMAIANRRPAPGAVVHSDHGTQAGFNRSSQHQPVVGSVGVRRGLRRWAGWGLCGSGAGRQPRMAV